MKFTTLLFLAALAGAQVYAQDATTKAATEATTKAATEAATEATTQAAPAQDAAPSSTDEQTEALAENAVKDAAAVLFKTLLDKIAEKTKDAKQAFQNTRETLAQKEKKLVESGFNFADKFNLLKNF